MYITSVAIENYKSFLNQQIFQFEPGFNLLLGTNNAGKTTVLDVIDMNVTLNEPHRSIHTIPNFGGHPAPLSSFEVTLSTCISEMRGLLNTTGLWLPWALPLDTIPTEAQVAEIMNFVKKDEHLKMSAIFGNGTLVVYMSANDLISGKHDNKGNKHWAACLRYGDSDLPSISMSIIDNIALQQYCMPFKDRIYRFNAQRKPGTESHGADTTILDREALSLPYCINHLQTTDAYGHHILCELVNRIFPGVKWVQAPQMPINNSFQLQCLPHRPEERRYDLSTPLSRMGAGIGNVIAMLYVVLTSRHPQVIAIDEPNAFLHPRALRELLAILESEGRQHQFILTVHSADVLTAVKVQTISLLDFDGVTTTVKQVGLKDLHALQGGLAELGIRMTDLHAKDRVLWVEGQTEEMVMPELLRWACPEVASGTAILRVERTGTFATKGMNPIEVAQIYERLSASSALAPPMICILLDGETRSKEERLNIEKSSGGKLRFLGRRMLENYLLCPKAIAATLAELNLNLASSVVEEALCEAFSMANLSGDLSEVDAARVLEKIFLEPSEAKLEFRKTRDVPVIVEHIVKNNPEHLAPLRLLLRNLFALH